MRKFLMGINEATGFSRSVDRIATTLGAEGAASAPPASPPLAPAPKSFSQYLTDIHAEAARNDVTGSTIGTSVGAVAGLVGGLAWARLRGHYVLSTIGGGSLGRNLPALLRAEERWAAVRNLIATAAGIGGSLLLGRRGHGSFWGFVLGAVAGGGAAHLVGLRRK